MFCSTWRINTKPLSLEPQAWEPNEECDPRLILICIMRQSRWIWVPVETHWNKLATSNHLCRTGSSFPPVLSGVGSSHTVLPQFHPAPIQSPCWACCPDHCLPSTPLVTVVPYGAHPSLNPVPTSSPSPLVLCICFYWVFLLGWADPSVPPSYEPRKRDIQVLGLTSLPFPDPLET